MIDGPQELLAQFVRAEARERGRRHVGLHADRHHARGGLRVADRLAERHLVGIIEPLPAELLRLVDAEQALLAHFLEKLVRREDAAPPPTLRVRIDLVLRRTSPTERISSRCCSV